MFGFILEHIKSIILATFPPLIFSLELIKKSCPKTNIIGHERYNFIKK